MKHDTSEDLVAALGNIRRRAMQIDLFTGEIAKKPKRGRGDHVRLKGGGLTAVPGMAHFVATGPAGTYCRECIHFGDIDYKRKGTPLIERDACRKAKELMGSVQRGGIGSQSSCKYFGPSNG